MREGQLPPLLSHPVLPVPHDVTCPPRPEALCGVPGRVCPATYPHMVPFFPGTPSFAQCPGLRLNQAEGSSMNGHPVWAACAPSSRAMQSCPVWGLGNGVAGGGAGTPARRLAWPSCEMSSLFQALPGGDSSHHWPSCQCKHESSSFQGSGC